ncbi:MAG TPA: hypothetical protein V6D10_03400 [Trichocoleus sp.]|jgi:hypothetical protein
MSEQPSVKDEAQLSDEELNGVSGGINERFKEAHDAQLNKSSEDGELSDKQLETVEGGVSSRFEEAHQEQLDK